MFTERRREITAAVSSLGYVIFYSLFLRYTSKNLFDQEWDAAVYSVLFLFTLIFYIVSIPAILSWGILAYQKQKTDKFKDDLSLNISVHGFAKFIISLAILTFFMTIMTLLIMIGESETVRNSLFWITLLGACIVIIPSFAVTANVTYLKLRERKRKSDLSKRIEDSRKEGYSSIFEKEKAISLGFEDSESWHEFVYSGYETKEEWESAKKQER
jgi:hypothetical protein